MTSDPFYRMSLDIDPIKLPTIDRVLLVKMPKYSAGGTSEVEKPEWLPVGFAMAVDKANDQIMVILACAQIFTVVVGVVIHAIPCPWQWQSFTWIRHYLVENWRFC